CPPMLTWPESASATTLGANKTKSVYRLPLNGRSSMKSRDTTVVTDESLGRTERAAASTTPSWEDVPSSSWMSMVAGWATSTETPGTSILLKPVECTRSVYTPTRRRGKL